MSQSMKSPIKVLQVVPELAYGGVEKIVRNCYNFMDKEKYVFDYVTHGVVEDYHQEMLERGHRIFYFSTIGKSGYKGYKKQIEQNLNISEYDIVHIHIGHLTGVYASAYRKCGADKTICHAHSTACVNSKQQILMPLLRVLAEKNATRLIACGTDAGKFCFGNASHELLYNGVELDIFQNVSDEDIAKVRHEFDIDDDTFVVGHVGHFSKQKNHEFVVGVIEKYRKVHPNVKFILVGDGPLKPLIEQEIKEANIENNVIFTGIRKDVPVLMKLFDVFILPSLFEGLPVVGVEAQAAGTPCLISDTIDQSLDVGLGLTSFLPISEGYDCWSSALEAQRKNSKTKISHETIAEAFRKSGYDVVSSANRLSKIYESIVGESGD